MSAWPEINFSDLVSDETGGNTKTLQSDYLPEGNYPIVDQGQSLIGGYTNDPTRVCKAELPVVIFGDHTKCFKFISFPFCLGADGTKVLRPKQPIDERYLYYALQRIHIPDAGYSRHFKYLKEGKIPLPPLDEQKRIVAILDQADELRRKRLRALDRLNQLGQAIFHEMFGDPKSNPRGLRRVALGEMADFYSGNSLPNGEPYAGQSDGHLLLKVSDLNHEENQQDIVRAAAWSPVPGSRAGTCPPNALIFPKRGGAIGTNKKRWLRRSAILDPNLMGVHPNETDLTMPFLNGWFQTFNLSDIASGSSVPQLNKQDLAPLEIPLPSVDEQSEYAERMDALSATRRSAAIALGLDNQLFTSLQPRAFRGEL